MAAPFVAITPADPYFVPDLIAYLASCWLLGRLGVRLLGIGEWGQPLGSAIFVFTTMVSPLASAIWIVPWSTTPAAALTLGALLAAVSFAERPRPATAFLAALCACGIGAFRPAEAALAAGPVGLSMLWTVLSRRPLVRGRAGMATAAAVGGAVALLAALALHAAVWGVAAGPYLEQSRRIGFDWSLVPLRWVSIVVGPQPLLPEGVGLAREFRWIAPGVAGMVACLLAPTGPGRARHLLIVSVASAQCVLLLAYRDLHPTGLWRYANYHYFTWLIPVFGLYCALLVRMSSALARRRRVALGAAACVVGLFFWRPALDPSKPSLHGDIIGPSELRLTSGTTGLSDALLVAADGTREGIEMAEAVGIAPDRRYDSFIDFKFYSRPGGFLLVPLRPLPSGLVITLPAGVTLNRAIPPVGVTQRATFGVPCWQNKCRAAPDTAWPMK